MHRITNVASYNELIKALQNTIIQKNYSKALILTDENVFNIYKEEIEKIKKITNINCYIHIISPGEVSKSLSTTSLIVKKLIEKGHQRDSVIINYGGGVVSDLGGFIASNYLRGIDYINIPTTIIGQIDAAIGGKTAINMYNIKNNFGSFYNPIEIINYDQFTNTLNNLQKHNGYGEILKYAILMGRKDLIELEYLDIVEKCVNYKMNIVKEDLYEKGKRSYLNLGHTLGHGLEALLDIPHGIAVMYGILFASYISLKLGYVDKDFFDDVFTLSKQIVTFDKYNISNIKLESLINHIKHDKKVFNKQIRWILPKGWGKILKEEVPQNLWVKLLDNYMKDGFYEKCINC